MLKTDPTAKTYQSIGEFVVAFQWVEDIFRQIGWLLIDPDKKDWPPVQLRTANSCELITKVGELFSNLIKTHDVPRGQEYAIEIGELCLHFHKLRRHRNNILHSNYMQLQAGGRTLGYLRTDKSIKIDPDTGETLIHSEPFEPEHIHQILTEYMPHMIQLKSIHAELIRWLPFEQYRKRA